MRMIVEFILQKYNAIHLSFDNPCRDLEVAAAMAALNSANREMQPRTGEGFPGRLGGNEVLMA